MVRDARADINITVTRLYVHTALSHASSRGCVDIARLLLAQGSNGIVKAHAEAQTINQAAVVDTLAPTPFVSSKGDWLY